MATTEIPELEKQIFELTTQLSELRKASAGDEVRDYEFSTIDGATSLLNMFGDKQQLLLNIIESTVMNDTRDVSFCSDIVVVGEHHRITIIIIIIIIIFQKLIASESRRERQRSVESSAEERTLRKKQHRCRRAGPGSRSAGRSTPGPGPRWCRRRSLSALVPAPAREVRPAPRPHRTVP